MLGFSLAAAQHLSVGVLGALLVALFLGGSMLAFGTAAQAHVTSDIVRELAAWRILDAAGGLIRNVVIKTGDYTILSPVDNTGDASGTIFTNRGATAGITFTLPAPVQGLRGVFYEFLGIADYSITVATATADTLIALNDVTADSIAQSTGTKLIASHMRFICDGVSWIGYGDAVGGTFTVAT